MPTHLLGRVCDKSSWARKGLSVFNTVIEPGFIGGLTLNWFTMGILNWLFQPERQSRKFSLKELKNPAQYNGKYQGQSSEPTPSKIRRKINNEGLWPKLLDASPIKNIFLLKKSMEELCSLSEVGYDVRIKQGLCFKRDSMESHYSSDWRRILPTTYRMGSKRERYWGFTMPHDLVGIGYPKSSWNRQHLHSGSQHWTRMEWFS